MIEVNDDVKAFDFIQTK